MVLAGVMDAADAIPEDDRAAATELAMTSGSGTVRLAAPTALPALAALEGLEAANARDDADPSPKVRAWAKKAPVPTPLALDDSRHSQQPPSIRARRLVRNAAHIGDGEILGEACRPSGPAATTRQLDRATSASPSTDLSTGKSYHLDRLPLTGQQPVRPGTIVTLGGKAATLRVGGGTRTLTPPIPAEGFFLAA